MAQAKLKLVHQTTGAKRAKRVLRLKRKNGVPRKTASLGAYQYQKDALKARAKRAGMSVSYYLNYLLWREWL